MAGVKRQRTNEMPRWCEVGKDLWWSSADLQHLVSNHRRGRHLLNGASHAFLTSIYMFFWSDSAWSQTSRTKHLCAKGAAAQVVLNATGLNVGASAAYIASKSAYDRCVKLSKSLARQGGVEKLRAHLESDHTFMVQVATQIQQDPLLVQILRQNEELEHQLNIIGQLQVVNAQLALQCEELDEQMETANDENDELKEAVKTAQETVKDANFALTQVDMDKSLVTDGTALLARLGKAERELNRMKKYSGGTKVLSRRVVEVERLLLNVESNAAEAETERLEMENEIEDLRARLKSVISIGRSLRRHKRDKAVQIKELFLVARSSADYASRCSRELQMQIEQHAEFSMAVGVMWAQCQEVCKNQDAALSQMTTQLQELKKLETFKDGQYTTKVRILFYDCLQRGTSAAQARESVKSQLETLDKEVTRLPSVSEIKNYPQVMLFATRIHLARKMHKSILHFKSTATEAWQHHRGNLVEYADGGQRGMKKYHATSFSFINLESGKAELLPSRCAKVHGGRTSDMNDNTNETLTMLQGMNSSLSDSLAL